MEEDEGRNAAEGTQTSPAQTTSDPPTRSEGVTVTAPRRTIKHLINATTPQISDFVSIPLPHVPVGG